MIKSLEALERIQFNYVSVFKARENGKTQLINDLNTIRKSLKALEIIKNKNVDTYLFKNNDNFNEYNWALYLCFHREDRKERQLTEEEYNLLKEILC